MAAHDLDRSIAVPGWVRELVRDAPSSIPVQVSGGGNRGGGSDAHARQTERARRELRRIIYAAIDRFVKAIEFELRVPGRYPGKSAASFQEVLGYLADRGKDFADDSKTLDNRIRIALMAEYENADAIPLKLEFRETAADAILATIVARFENRLRDIDIAPNSQAYTRRKVRDGDDSRVGIRTGKLLAAIRARGQVKITRTP